ncbi:MAG: tRNA modification GTPase [Myxococcota bacterium]
MPGRDPVTRSTELDDVVIALATPWGNSALAVIRWTGRGSFALATALCRPHRPGPWRHQRSRRVDVMCGHRVLDDGVLWVSRGPASYTGEDSGELTVHGNPFIVRQVLRAAVALGARLADPGDFTRRALANGKMDLVRAEGLLAVAAARTEEGLRLGRAGLDGHASAQWATWESVVLDAIAELEARLDYPDDELALSADSVIRERLRAVAAQARAAADASPEVERAVRGATVAIVGPPNVGKSTLFNALVGEERALVFDRAGTTRDVLEAEANLGPLVVTLVDTAGDRVTTDPVEAAGQQQAAKRIRTADLILHLSAIEDHMHPHGVTRREEGPVIYVANGLDRVTTQVNLPSDVVPISALHGEGLSVLTSRILDALVGELPESGQMVLTTERQAQHARRLADAIAHGLVGWEEAGVAVGASLLMEGLECVAEATGRDPREAALDRLFARFCIGK